MEVQPFLNLQLELGEGPRWDGRSGHLYFVDIRRGNFIRRQLATGKMEQSYIGMPLGAIGFCRSEKLVMATKAGFGLWDLKTRTIEMVPGLRIDRMDTRFNDGVVDSAGRFWAGTQAPQGQAILYRLDPDGTVHTMDTGFTICNGMGWSPDNRTMYFTDSMAHTIYAYDFDLDSGAIVNRRDFVHVTDPAEAVPDGLAVDAEGCIWSAMWGGSKVSRFDPQGRLMHELSVPARHVTACTFGGPQLDTLYITTAWSELTLEQRAAQPQSGDLFVVPDPGVKGQPESLFGI
jgi:sugar lactone lactonase YvrE